MTKTSLAVRGSRCLLTCAALIATLFISTGSAQAQATVIRFSSPPQTETSTGPLEGCLPPDLIGTSTLTETTTGQAVDTGNGIVNVHGVNTFDYHGDFPNGIYVQSGLNRDIFSFHITSLSAVQHFVDQDLRTIYAADGTPIGTLSIHANAQITIQDTNGNGELDPGEITVNFEHFRLHCG